MSLRTPAHVQSSAPRCGQEVPAGMLSYHCSLPQGHDQGEDPEPHWAIESDRAARAWDAWSKRQEAKSDPDAPRILRCPQCLQETMQVGRDRARCTNCGETAEWQPESPGHLEHPEDPEEVDVEPSEAAEAPFLVLRPCSKPAQHPRHYYRARGSTDVMTQRVIRECYGLAHVVVEDESVPSAHPALVDTAFDADAHLEGADPDEPQTVPELLEMAQKIAAEDAASSRNPYVSGPVLHREQCRRTLPHLQHIEREQRPGEEFFCRGIPGGPHPVPLASEVPLPLRDDLPDRVPALEKMVQDKMARDQAQQPTRTRPGDQVLPSGDESIEDDQSLLIADIEARRQLGISRYGQGHRPFNGRDTLQDFYDEHLDALVYLRSLKRMADATREQLVEAVTAAFDKEGVYDEANSTRHLAEIAVDRIMGWVQAQILGGPSRSESDVAAYIRRGLTKGAHLMNEDGDWVSLSYVLDLLDGVQNPSGH